MAVAKDRVKYAAGTAKPYLSQALRDEEFRRNLRAAFTAARAIYEELVRERDLASVASRAASDEEIHANLRRAIQELRQAADRLQEREESRSRPFRKLALLLSGVAIGLFFNPFTGPTARRWVAGRMSRSVDGSRSTSANGSG